ncbi:hypothetical protein DW107_03615 [Tannerella sp. AM09-19]|nr:hypothetical protein DW107_03615 [Tannerella sp. AM09-19]
MFRGNSKCINNRQKYETGTNDLTGIAIGHNNETSDEKKTDRKCKNDLIIFFTGKFRSTLKQTVKTETE